jgi:hypothetical protein
LAAHTKKIYRCSVELRRPGRRVRAARLDRRDRAGVCGGSGGSRDDEPLKEVAVLDRAALRLDHSRIPDYQETGSSMAPVW